MQTKDLSKLIEKLNHERKNAIKNGFDSKLLDEVVLELRQQKPLAQSIKTTY